MRRKSLAGRGGGPLVERARGRSFSATGPVARRTPDRTTTPPFRFAFAPSSDASTAPLLPPDARKSHETFEPGDARLSTPFLLSVHVAVVFSALHGHAR
ncbi:hypothetical protein MTO96_026199 [Rhipicephalus appendiculatus]